MSGNTEKDQHVLIKSDSSLVQKNIASVKKKEHIMNLHSFAKFLIGAINLR